MKIVDETSSVDGVEATCTVLGVCRATYYRRRRPVYGVRRRAAQRRALTVEETTAVLVAQLLADLGVTKTHSRPHVSNDNPYSEAAFKTLKYRPGFPERFGSIEDARAHCVDFFAWYNGEHYHSGLGLQTPDDVHHGRAQRVVDERAAVLAAAHAAHPERFVRGVPRPAALPTAVWINKPNTAHHDRLANPPLN
jgi:putative transposase